MVCVKRAWRRARSERAPLAFAQSEAPQLNCTPSASHNHSAGQILAAAPWPRAKMVSAMRVPNTSATYNGQWVIRDVSRLRSIDHAISSLSCKVLHQLNA